VNEPGADAAGKDLDHDLAGLGVLPGDLLALEVAALLGERVRDVGLGGSEGRGRHGRGWDGRRRGCGCVGRRLCFGGRGGGEVKLLRKFVGELSHGGCSYID
jgi:hypothetical protein